MAEDIVPAPALAPAPAGDPAPWYNGADSDTVGYLQTKGWDKLEPTAAISAAIKSYREAEGMLGIPKDQLVRRPNAEDPASISAFWQQFGKPASKDQYDFTGVKFQDGSALDDSFVNHIRDTADALHLPKDTAARVAESFVKFMEGADAAELAQNQAAVQTQMAELQKNWGQNYDAHKFVANQGALKLGVTQAEFDAMFQTPGGAKMIDIFHKVGNMSGEGRFVAGGQNNPGTLTRDQAVSQKNSLMNDSAWVDRYLKGGAQEVSQMTALNTIITSGMEEADFFG